MTTGDNSQMAIDLMQGRHEGRKHLYCIGFDPGPQKFGVTANLDRFMSHHRIVDGTLKHHFSINCPEKKAEHVERAIKLRFLSSLAWGRDWFSVPPEELFDSVVHELTIQRHPLLGRRGAGSGVTYWIGSDWSDRVDLAEISAENNKFSLRFLNLPDAPADHRVHFDRFVSALEYAEETIFNVLFAETGEGPSPVAPC